MSAPRKIRTSHLQSRMIDLNGKGGTEVYHHDDVVRELERELQAALAYFDHHGITGGSVETTRAALAKIAQHDS